MTVCIALICREDLQPRIIACIDSRLDGTSGSTDRAIKFDLLGYNWIALMSGDDWPMATNLAKAIGARIQRAKRPTKVDTIFDRVGSATKDFQSSRYFTTGRRVDLIIAGFIGDEPILMYTGYDNGPYTTLCGDTAVVGSGYQIANAFLGIRHYGPIISEREAIYIAYEAKKYSENAPGVGPGTWMTVMFPFPEAKASGELRMNPLGHPQLDELEKTRKRLGLKRVSPEDVPDLRLPTTDQSPPPPSPE